MFIATALRKYIEVEGMDQVWVLLFNYGMLGKMLSDSYHFIDKVLRRGTWEIFGF